MTKPQFDPTGTPYFTGYGPPFPHDSAVDLGTFTPDEFLNQPSGPQSATEAPLGVGHLYGSPLTRHAQQAQARAYARGRQGFDSVVSLRVEYPTGTTTLFHHVDGWWKEVFA